MPEFSSRTEEFLATQCAAEDLLNQIASSEGPVSDHDLLRLEKLAESCARLGFSGGLDIKMDSTISNLIGWCDHLNDLEFKSKFIDALKQTPLSSPWSSA